MQPLRRLHRRYAANTLISVLICFSALLPIMQIIFLRCGPQHKKMISIVAYTAEKLSSLLTTTRKNVWIRIYPRIQNHIWIKTRVSIRGLGWCVPWRKVEVKNLVNCPFKSPVAKSKLARATLSFVYYRQILTCNMWSDKVVCARWGSREFLNLIGRTVFSEWEPREALGAQIPQ